MADMIIFKLNNKVSVELIDLPVCVHFLQVDKHLTCINEKAFPVRFSQGFKLLTLNKGFIMIAKTIEPYTGLPKTRVQKIILI